MVTRFRILFFNCLFFGIAISLAGQEYTEDFEDGLALVTTSKGDVAFKSPGGTTHRAELHAVESLTGMEITCEEREHIFLALSNGSALGIYENSKVRIERYGQRPFTSEKENLEFEPSRSKLVLELTKGSITFSAEQLSPISQIIIKLPMGQVEISRASGRVVHSERGAQVMITGGIVTFNSPGLEEEEFIHSPNVMRVSEDPSHPNRILIDRLPANYPLAELTEFLVKATHRAKERVIFKISSEEASIPRPILVAKPETLRKSSPRPYTYKDND